jgi:hypothetical protein
MHTPGAAPANPYLIVFPSFIEKGERDVLHADKVRNGRDEPTSNPVVPVSTQQKGLVIGVEWQQPNPRALRVILLQRETEFSVAELYHDQDLALREGRNPVPKNDIVTVSDSGTH